MQWQIVFGETPDNQGVLHVRQTPPYKFAHGPSVLLSPLFLQPSQGLCSLTRGRRNTTPMVGRVTSHSSSLNSHGIAVDELTSSSPPLLDDSALSLPSSMPTPPSLFWFDPPAFMPETSTNLPYVVQSQFGLQSVTYFKPCFPSPLNVEVVDPTSFHSLGIAGAYIVNSDTSLIFIPNRSCPLCTCSGSGCHSQRCPGG